MNLLEILECNNNPLKEDQVWTICYKCATLIKNVPKTNSNIQFLQDTEGSYLCPNGLQSIVVNHTGNVKIMENIEKQESNMLSSLGLVLFKALDYGLREDEEQLVSSELENLISFMTTDISDPVDPDSCDEGYNDEKLVYADAKCTLEIVIESCKQNFSSNEDRYTSICVSLYNDALVLKTLLDQVVTTTKELQKLDHDLGNDANRVCESNNHANLEFQSWARLWVQVLSDLRQGARLLRKVEVVPTSNKEFRLTPYEILMREIKQKRFSLRKTTSMERCSKGILHPSIHDEILNFIRSKPALSPVHKRVLRPCPPRSKSLHERLIEQIHEHSADLLKPVHSQTNGRITSSQTFDVKDTSTPVSIAVTKRKEYTLASVNKLDVTLHSTGLTFTAIYGKGSLLQTSSKRRLIPPTFDEVSLDLTQSKHELAQLTHSESDLSRVDRRLQGLRNQVTCNSMDSLRFTESSSTTCLQRTCSVRFTDSMRRKQLLPPDDHTSYMRDTLPSLVRARGELTRSNSARRHRIPSRLNMSAEEPRTSPDTTNHDPAFNRSYGRWSCRLPNRPSSMRAPSTFGQWRRAVAPPRGSTSVDDREYKPNQVECLSLTVEEVMHIRQVLTRADLEKFQYSKELYGLLKNEKICFSCKLKKFSLFSWAHSCEICRRKVCGKCLRKLQAPTEKYLQTPVFALTPHPILHKKDWDKNSAQKSELYMPGGGWSILRNEVRKNNQESSLYFKAWNGRKMEVCVDCFHLISGVLLVGSGVNQTEPISLYLNN